MNWLVTGGCGFIGTALIRSLMEEGGRRQGRRQPLCRDAEDLAAGGLRRSIVRRARPIVSGGHLELVAGDITDEDLALKAARGADVIVHFAANTG